jgi:glutathione S-transferase
VTSPHLSPIDYVDVATARTAPGVRIVVSGLVPSPWSEAAKGLFRIANVPVLAVRRGRDATEITAWTGIDNVPVVVHAAEPARTSWAPITTLAARLAGPDAVLPEELAARVETMGLLHEIAGEHGLGWNARLAMIDATITSEGKRGFPLPVGQYLARRYGYTPEAAALGRARIEHQIHALRDRLRAQQALGHAYLGGPRVSALDVYLATFLTPLSDITAEDCPQLDPNLRQAFGCAREAFGSLVPDELWAHRKHVFERHLGWPIAL